ncbi:hypothetical protein C8046_03890 [Serinibacter arcticus]|uniref:Oxygen sensor histidine kinase NreB n=1 Tax=Serinibacter arcticus TaxID=1655435 RepID=A0A2U1ZSI9_9MICO|nr:sensor histidine kinase [Serinibacter arcticus]PWD49949.1 hypothetical protein C8046_03890 [Serinibacter arcticus]
MSDPAALRRRALVAAGCCATLVLTALALVVVVGPERALVTHLVEDTAAALAWVGLAVACALRNRPTGSVLTIAGAWSVAAVTGGWSLVLDPSAAAAVGWASAGSWGLGVGLAYTLGVLTAARWSSPRVLRRAAVAASLLVALAFATLPTVTTDDQVRPNPVGTPLAPVLAVVGVIAVVVVAFAVIAALAMQASSPARRRTILPVLVAALAGLVAIGTGAFATQWAPIAQALTVPLLPLTIAATVLGTPGRGRRSVAAQLDGAADPSSALAATLAELGHELGLTGLAIEVDGRTVASVGGSFDDVRLPLVHLGRPEGHLLTPPLDEDAADEIGRVAPSVAAVLASVRLVEELRRSRAELTVAREAERRRVRRDLHDEIGPLLAAVAVQTEAAALTLERSPDSSRRSLAKARAAGSDAVLALRRIVRDLQPVAVDDLGLVGALEELAARLTGPATVTVTSSPTPPLSAAVEVALYRIAAEAAGNAVRHAAATRVRLALTVVDGAVVLTVDDDGCGFDTTGPVAGAAAGAGAGVGIGLGSMRERAAELDGRLSIGSSATGTTVRAELPVPAAGGTSP